MQGQQGLARLEAAVGPGHGKIELLTIERVANINGSPRSALVTLLVVIGAIGSLALLAWLGVVMLDLKHLNTSGFTLP